MEDLEFLEKLGVVDFKYEGEWEGYKVYSPVFDEEHDGQKIGLPIFVIEKDGKKEVVQDYRSMQILRSLPDEE